MHQPTQKRESVEASADPKDGSVEAFADPRNTIHPADCPMIVSLMSQDVMLRVKKYVCAL